MPVYIMINQHVPAAAVMTHISKLFDATSSISDHDGQRVLIVEDKPIVVVS